MVMPWPFKLTAQPSHQPIPLSPLPSQQVAAPVAMVNLNGRSNNLACPTGSYVQLVSQNFKRRWLVIKVPITEPDTLVVVLAREEPAAGREFTTILLDSGDSLVLSMSGDMPWQGGVWATGLTADSWAYWSEVEEWP